MSYSLLHVFPNLLWTLIVPQPHNNNELQLFGIKLKPTHTLFYTHLYRYQICFSMLTQEKLPFQNTNEH